MNNLNPINPSLKRLSNEEDAEIVFSNEPEKEVEQPSHRPQPRLGRRSILYMAKDFDEPLEEMKESME